jgi:hypothetical protein
MFILIQTCFQIPTGFLLRLIGLSATQAWATLGVVIPNRGNTVLSRLRETFGPGRVPVPPNQVPGPEPALGTERYRDLNWAPRPRNLRTYAVLPVPHLTSYQQNFTRLPGPGPPRKYAAQTQIHCHRSRHPNLSRPKATRALLTQFRAFVKNLSILYPVIGDPNQ